MDPDHEDRRAKIAKKKQDKGRRRPRKVHKKRLHILFDPYIKAFQSWKAVVEPWPLATCEKFIEWCHIGKAFLPSHHVIHKKHNVTNLKYYTWPEFKERCIQVHQFLYEQPNMKSNSIILSILRMVYAEVALLKKVNWMTMRSSSITKMIIPMSPDIPRVWKYLDGRLGRMMDHAVISNEQVNWSCTSSNDDLTGCEPEIKREKEDVIKCAWLNNTLLDMVAQDEVKSTQLHVEIAGDVQGQEPLEFLPHTEAIEEEPHPNDNAKHILERQEELRRAWARIEEQNKHIEDLQSELLVKDELIRRMQEKH
jgi:hypothetical protein